MGQKVKKEVWKEIFSIFNTEDIKIGLAPGWVLCTTVSLFFIFNFNMPELYRYLPLVISAIFLGMPHGAIDYLIPSKLQKKSKIKDSIIKVSILYLILGSVYTIIWFFYPVFAFWFFILLTLFHWGQGDLYILVSFLEADYIKGKLQRIITIIVRGGLPMLVPLISYPDNYEKVVKIILGLFTAQESLESVGFGIFFKIEFRIFLGAIFGIIILIYLSLGFLRSSLNDISSWFIDLGEIGLLTTYFIIVPPIFAIGIYFTFWHSLRHIIRTMLLDDKSSKNFRSGEIYKPMIKFSIEALPLTFIALFLFIPLFWIIPKNPDSIPTLVGLYLVLISILTLPHVVIVSWMDISQNIWNS